MEVWRQSEGCFSTQALQPPHPADDEVRCSMATTSTPSSRLPAKVTLLETFRLPARFPPGAQSASSRQGSGEGKLSCGRGLGPNAQPQQQVPELPRVEPGFPEARAVAATSVTQKAHQDL